MIGAMALGLSLAACSENGFVDEGSDKQEDLSGVDGGLAKSVLISMGAIEDTTAAAAAPKYQPRPTLVVPAQRTLPPPVDQDAALAAKGFPVDPEVRDEQERAERRKTVVSTGSGTMSLADQAKFKDLPTVGPGNDLPTSPAAQRASELPLKPWELDGKAQAAALDKAQNSGSASKERSLLAPPTDYRTPSDKAPLESPQTGIAAMKPGWWPF